MESSKTQTYPVMLYKGPTTYVIAETAEQASVMQAEGWHGSPACTEDACVCGLVKLDKTPKAPVIEKKK